VEHANQTLSPIFDKEKEQQRLQQTQLIGEIGNQVADIARIEGQINAINAGKTELAKEKINEPEKGASKEAWEKYNAQLAATEGYKAAQKQWGTGSSVQQAIQAATAAVQGLAGSDLKAALAGGAAPYVAEVIGHYSNLDDAGKVAAHAVVNAALAAAQNQSALAGAAGAATGELIGIIATQMYGKTVSELDETQRQTVSTLATLAAGLAGGLAGDSSASAVSGAQAGKTTVENNSLAGDSAREAAKQAAESLKNQIREKLGEGTSSAIANAIINGLADTGDTALGSADYVADAAMALASCAVGDSYCNKAMSDLAGKNQAVADSVAAMMNSDTWSAMKDTVVQASEGNQAALEATGGMLAAIILPGKKVPHVPNAGAVGNMNEFFKKSGFGELTKSSSQKTSKIYQGQAVYKASDNVYENIRKGDQFYLDAKHKDHLEVFDQRGNFIHVLNLDGTINPAKTAKAAAEGRRLPK
jgi:filamentous hemagglutinin